MDEIVAAHRSLAGRGPARRFATLQVNCAYAMLLASQFQRFCRNLHTEAADHVCTILGKGDTAWAVPMTRARLTQNRRIDKGNANPTTLGVDFGRFELAFWPDARADNIRNGVRQKKLEQLNAWRNAIAHQDFAPAPALDARGRKNLRMNDVNGWRSACDGLAVSFDRVIGVFLLDLVVVRPW